MPVGVYPRTEEHSRKIGLAQKGKPKHWKNGHPMLGKHHTEEAKKRMSKKHIGMWLGEKSPTWIDGRWAKTKGHYDSLIWKETRKLVYARDNWTCQICKKHCYTDIQCHHIVPYSVSQDDR